MSITSLLTIRHLMRNKKRTIVTILGIATSTSLISAILIGAFSFFSFFGYLATRTDGNVHAAFYEVSKEQMQMLKADERIANAGLSDTTPQISGVKVESGAQERYRIGNVMHADAVFFEEMIVSEFEGKLPENEGEIAVEEEFLTENGLTLCVGDELTFDQGYRSSVDENGEIVYLAGNYNSEETFTASETETCKITAILHGNKPTKGFDILRGMDPGEFPQQKYAEVRIALKKCDHTAIKQIKQIAEDTGLFKYALNTEYMLSVFAFEGGTGAYRALFSMMIAALVIIVITSVVLIVNSIGMSLTERMRYLGMLASVGATARQKRFSIYFEGLVLGVIAIPLGILIGLIGTKATLTVLGTRILELDILAGAEGMRGSIPIVYSPKALLVIVITSSLTIFVSTLMPAIRASKIMPVDALRETNTIRVRAKKLRINPLIRRLCGYEGELAYKNIRRNGIKGTIITVSIAISVIMFLTISFFCDSVKRLNQYDFNFPAQIVVSCALDESDMLREKLMQMDQVEKVFSGAMIRFPFQSSDENTVPANRDITDPSFLTDEYAALSIQDMSLVLVDDADFEKLLSENGLEKEKYFGDTLRGVLLNSFFHDAGSGEVFTDAVLGQSLHYDETQGNPPAVQIGDFVSYDAENYVFAMTPRGSLTVFVPASKYYEKAKETLPSEILTNDLCVVTKAHKELVPKIYEMLEKDGYHNYNCSDLTDTLEIMNAITLMLKTVMYGFAILLTLIAVANIVNTISTGVLLRRREFAMYKSVGMADIGFKKMIRLETFLYGIRALVFAIPVSLLISYLMYRSFDRELFTFDPNWLMYLLVILVVFAVVSVSMLLSIHKLKDDNIIEALKYENA